MWTQLKGYQAFLLCMWNKCFHLHCGLRKLMLTGCINTAVNYRLIDCKEFFSTAAILRFDSDSKRGWTFGLPWWRIRLQRRKPGFDPWVGKIPWRRERLPTPVFWPGESHGLYSSWGRKESHLTEWLSKAQESAKTVFSQQKNKM